MESLERFWDAVEAFFAALGEVGFGALLLALLFHVANLALRTRGWRTIIAAGHPGARVRWRDTFGAYCAGVGVNAIVPARGGDVVKLYLIRQRVEGSTYPALASGLVAETAFDAVIGFSLILWAFQTGGLPSLPALPGLGAFEFSWFARHPMAFSIGLVVLLGVIAALMVIFEMRIRAFWARVGQGLAVLRTPKRYLTGVVSYQLVGWGCRVTAAVFFLHAFHVPATPTNALLVLVIQSVATTLPLTPGGIGPKQALAVIVLAGEAARSDLLAFSVGMELSILVANVAIGAVCLGVMMKGFRFRRAIREAKEARLRAATESGAQTGPTLVEPPATRDL